MVTAVCWELVDSVFESHVYSFITIVILYILLDLYWCHFYFRSGHNVCHIELDSC